MQDSLRRFKAGVFQALAHPTRIAIVELLRDEKEVPVSRIYERLGLEQTNASQHLAVLRSKQIVVGRKYGNQVLYSLRDPILGKVLNLMRQYFQSHLNEALQMLKDMDR
jgi:ArsR family transcriptional regulator